MPAQSLFREPFVHFAVLGLGLFVLWEAVGVEEAETPPAQQVTLKTEEVEMASLSFAERAGRDPSPEELDELLAARVDEELLYLEGLANGLNRGDPVVRRRVIQKQRFLLEELRPAADPTEAEIEARLLEQPDRYRSSQAVAFTQHFFDSERRRNAEEDARAAEIQLQVAQEEPASDPFALGDDFGLRSLDAHRDELGPAFAAVLAETAVGKWELAQSRWGWHLVQVVERVEAAELTEASIREQVRYDLLEERRAASVAGGLDSIRSRYDITIEGR